MLFAFEKSPTVISLSYKLVPVLYREYKYDLLLGHGEGVRGGGGASLPDVRRCVVIVQN